MFLWLGLSTSLALLLAGYLVLAPLMWMISRRLERGANFLFAVRIAPATLAAAFVVFVSWPSFLVFEPRVNEEAVGWKLAVVAAIAAAGVAWSVIRLVRACVATNRVTREWSRHAEATQLEGVTIPTYRFDHEFPVMAVAGVFRPRLFIANKLLRALTPEELAAAAAHEMGHVTARDNLRRALLFLLPDGPAILGRPSTSAWTEASDRAADAFAVRAGARAALDLASALVKTARLTPPEISAARPPRFQSLMMQSLVSGEAGVAGRVQEILAVDSHRVAPRRARFNLLALPIAALLIGFWSSTATLHAAHEVLERFVHLLT